MKFLCERCGTRYSIADDKVRQKILKIRCKSCDNVITLRESLVPEAPLEAGKAAVSRPVPTMAQAAGVSAPSLPPPPKAAVAPPERPEWHLAVDGQQKGPFTKAQLATAVLAQKPAAEVFVWKDGLDGWKEPSKVPEIERALAQAKSGKGGAPPRPPTMPSLPVAKPLAALAQSAARSPSSAGRAASVSASDHMSAFDEGEATQIQPLSAAMMGDLASSGDLVGDDDDKTPVANLGGLARAEGAAVNGNGKHVVGYGGSGQAAPASRPPLDLFSDAPSAPFFPPPTANAPGGRNAAPAPSAPHMSMSGESGLSQVMSLGGRVSRKPWLKYVAVGAAVLLLGSAVTMAFVGGGTQSTRGNIPAAAGPGTEPGSKTPEQLEKAAADEAKKWFPDQAEAGKVAHVGSAPVLKAPAGAKRPATPGGKTAVDPLAPPPLAPPPPGFGDGPTPTPERKVDFGIAERRAVATKKAVSNAPPVDQASIGNVVRRKENQDAVKLCYNRVLRRTGAQTGGRIEVVVNIGISGRVKSVNLSSPAALNAVHDCLKQAVNRWHFPVSPEDYETGFTLVLSGS